MIRKNKLIFSLLFVGLLNLSGCSLVKQEVNKTIDSGKKVINSGIEDGKNKVDTVVDNALNISEDSKDISSTEQTTSSKLE
ncbi:hypothetical protein ACFJYZ_08310 [Enterococcus faecalis]